VDILRPFALAQTRGVTSSEFRSKPIQTLLGRRKGGSSGGSSGCSSGCSSVGAGGAGGAGGGGVGWGGGIGDSTRAPASMAFLPGPIYTRKSLLLASKFFLHPYHEPPRIKAA
jgi:hypothetical protein